MAQSGSRSAHLIKQMSTHTSMHLQYALTVVEAELLSPIKDACHVCVVCFCLLLMPGPSGSSQVNKSMSFDKHASHPRAYVLPGARDSSELTLLMFESPRWDPASLISRLADSIHTHSYCSHREQPLFFFRLFFPGDCVYCEQTHTHTAPGYSITCGTPHASEHTVAHKQLPLPCHFKLDLIKTTLTRLLSSHLSM